MIKDLTTLKWRKNIYYVSDNIIFDIESKKKTFDTDYCGTYLVDLQKASEKFQNATDGTIHVIEPEAYINNVPYIIAEFTSDSERVIKRYFPLQYLIEEGDKVLEDKVIQTHPDVFDNKYINKFNQEVFDIIKKIVKDPFNKRTLQLVMNSLPDWLTISEELPMTEDYIDKYFLKGQHYNQKIASKGENIFYFKSIKLGIGEDLYPVNIWNKEILTKAINAINAELLLNKFGGTVDTLEFAAEAMKEIVPGTNLLSTFLNYNNGNIKFESLCASPDIDTYYEYIKVKEAEKAKIRSYFNIVSDEFTYDENMREGKGLAQYYAWSDQANAPYKEDLWNTVANRAANLNDARRDEETGELVLDENGNYIYDNCERCWQGAVNAPGAKYPWVVLNIQDDVHSTITFKYTYPDGTVKEVNPWGDRVFGKKENEPSRTWGVASVAAEFQDDNFLISANRNDGKDSTFDVNRFEIVLNPVE